MLSQIKKNYSIIPYSLSRVGGIVNALGTQFEFETFVGSAISCESDWNVASVFHSHTTDALNKPCGIKYYHSLRIQTGADAFDVCGNMQGTGQNTKDCQK